MFVVMMVVSLKLYKVLRSIELLSDQCCRKLRKKVIYLLTVFVKIIENFTTMVYVVLIFNSVVLFNLFCICMHVFVFLSYFVFFILSFTLTICNTKISFPVTSLL